VHGEGLHALNGFSIIVDVNGGNTVLDGFYANDVVDTMPFLCIRED
jgi:hypothetical protein